MNLIRKIYRKLTWWFTWGRHGWKKSDMSDWYWEGKKNESKKRHWFVRHEGMTL